MDYFFGSVFSFRFKAKKSFFFVLSFFQLTKEGRNSSLSLSVQFKLVAHKSSLSISLPPFSPYLFYPSLSLSHTHTNTHTNTHFLFICYNQEDGTKGKCRRGDQFFLFRKLRAQPISFFPFHLYMSYTNQLYLLISVFTTTAILKSNNEL